MVAVTKDLHVLVAENVGEFMLSRAITIIWVAVIVEAYFESKRSESNFNELMGFPIGTILTGRALFVF